jgi:DNA-binding IscR family transcriptional regulator
MEVESRHDITLIKALARAFRWLRMLESGRFATISELAVAEKINASYVARIVSLR